MYDEKFMKRAIQISKRALTEPGTQPFGAVVVRDGKIVGEGLNHSVAHWDPTSHGETEAVRDACRNLKTVDLSGADLYSSYEPCALCVATMLIAGISKLYYASSLDQSGKAFTGVSRAARHPVDVGTLRAEAGKPANARVMPAEQKLAADAIAVLDEWASKRKGRWRAPGALAMDP